MQKPNVVKQKKEKTMLDRKFNIFKMTNRTSFISIYLFTYVLSIDVAGFKNEVEGPVPL